MSATKPPAEKLPLAVRKNLRDEWEHKKAGLEDKLLSLTSIPWHFEVNPLQLWPYAQPGNYSHNAFGECIFAYFDSFVSTFSYFLESHSDGANELNAVCPKHIVTFIPSDKVNYSGCEVQDGKLCLLFNPECLGVNINSVAAELGAALSSAPQPAGAPTLSFTARDSIKNEYDNQIVSVLAKARKALENPDFEFEPGFEALGEALKKGKGVGGDWEKSLGSYAREYFESFVNQLEREGFGADDLLREGLEEGVPEGVLKLRIVEKLGDGFNYNEILLEDGVLVIQTTPDMWGTNIYNAAERLVSIL